ncbi:hypothetical protein C8T65DRAFT_583405, partial [Cerioporus squamosus]
LPLNEFQNGKQLIQVVRDCVLAHQHATKDAKLLHRDISSGNILIYPKLMWVKDPQKKRLQIKFTGLLADWEMAKPTDPQQQGQRQPERTGTYQYMSVALLSHLKANVEVCDEIESFFYVVLYHAVRYLKSNFNDNTVANYIDEFFDQYGYVNDKYTCGNAKLLTIVTGKLANSTTKLEFAAAGMNRVLNKLLSWFHAHHIVTEYDRAPKDSSSKSTVAPSSPLSPSRCPPTPPSHPLTLASPSGAALFTENEIEAEGDEDDSESNVDITEDEDELAPTAPERRRARLVVTHAAMLKLLKESLEWGAETWAHSETLGDRVPATWRPDRKTAVTTRTSNKRQRLDDAVQSEPPDLPQLPPRFPKTPTRPSRRGNPWHAK